MPGETLPGSLSNALALLALLCPAELMFGLTLGQIRESRDIQSWTDLRGQLE